MISTLSDDTNHFAEASAQPASGQNLLHNFMHVFRQPGLGMLDGVLDLIPTAKISVVGLQRDEETLQPVSYFEKLVDSMNERPALILDPMLATGGSVNATINLLKSKGCRNIKVLVLVAAPEGVKAVNEAHPDVTIYSAALDSHLDEHGYIIPGLGDAGDKIFGTR